MQSTRIGLAASLVVAAFAVIGVGRPARADLAAYFDEPQAVASDNPIQLTSCHKFACDAASPCGNEINCCQSCASRHLCEDCQAQCESPCDAPQPQCCGAPCGAPCDDECGPYCDERPMCSRPRFDFRSCTPYSDRWYVSVSGGWEQRETVHEADDSSTFIKFKSGFLANAALGMHCNNWRLELETTFMNNSVDIAGAGGESSKSAGNVNLRAYMFNLYRDFHCGRGWLNPYVGAGIGVYQSELNGLYPNFFDDLGSPFEGNPINATSNMPLCYQFRAGVSCPLSDRADIYSGYRYFKGEELEFASAPFASFAPTFHPDGAVINAVELGIRVNF